MAQEQTYYVKGMHCAACEVLIEKKLLEIPGVKAVDASTADGRATIEYEGEKPAVAALNDIFQKDHYTFFESKHGAGSAATTGGTRVTGLAVAVSIVALFLGLERLGIAGFMNIHSNSSLFSFFGFGVLAGLSSCAALVGGMVLSLSKQWNALYAADESFFQKMQPHVLFNAGRVFSYGVLGGVLGLIGSRLAFSLTMTAWLIVAVCIVMIILAGQLLDIPVFRKFQIRMPKSMTRAIADEKKFHGKYMPFAMGAATFFLPCGLTITAQTIALLSASPWKGAGIMGLFALGTVPVLLLIGMSSVKFLARPHVAGIFSQAAGFLVLFFALYTLWGQTGLLGF